MKKKNIMQTNPTSFGPASGAFELFGAFKNYKNVVRLWSANFIYKRFTLCDANR